MSAPGGAVWVTTVRVAGGAGVTWARSAAGPPVSLRAAPAAVAAVSVKPLREECGWQAGGGASAQGPQSSATAQLPTPQGRVTVTVRGARLGRPTLGFCGHCPVVTASGAVHVPKAGAVLGPCCPRCQRLGIWVWFLDDSDSSRFRTRLRGVSRSTLPLTQTRVLGLDVASQEKERLEEKQRAARRERATEGVEWHTR